MDAEKGSLGRARTLRLCLIAAGSMINVAGSDIALFMGIPIYLNSIGTVICAVRYGPSAGMIAGAAGALICGVTTDIYSLYYLPVQIIAGGAAGLIFRKYRPGEGNSIRRIIISAAAIAIPVSLVSAVITAFVFGGVTSSESSVLVQILHNAAGMGLVASVFTVQFITDFANCLISVWAAFEVQRRMPRGL
jgi:hypothetical protein